jgi:hypothetical protein
MNLKKINEEIQLIRKELGYASKAPFLKGSIKEARQELTALKQELLEANSTLGDFSAILKGSISELTKGNFELSLAKKQLRGLVSIADQFNQIQMDGVLMDQEKIEKLKQQGNQHFENLKYAERMGDLTAAQRKELQELIADQKKYNEALAEAEEFQKRVKGASGVKVFGALNEITKAFPGLSTLTSVFSDVASEVERVAVANEQAAKYEEEIYKSKKDQQEADLAALESGKGLTKEAAERLGIADDLKFKKDGTVKMSSLAGKDKDALALKAPKITEGVPKTMNTMMAGIKKLGPALTKALGPIALVVQLIKGMMEANKQVVGLQKTMMLTQSEASDFNQDLQNAAMATGDIAVTGTKVFETFMSLSKEAGFVAKFSMATLGSATKLQKVLGISESSTAGLAMAAEATGTSLEENYKQVLGTSYEMQRQAGTQLDMKEVLEETGNVTGQIRANMGGNTVEIAKAVTQAKLLGTSLETVAAAGRQMLDFESSINKEMEAELMTGKQLNLDRARAAALAGDQATVAEELAKNMGDFTEFSKMNVLQQEALAGAMGMTADQVADMLFKQQVMGRTAEELRQQGEEELAQKLEAKSAQDQMNAAMEQLKQTFVQLGTALLPIVNVITIIAGVFQMLVGLIQDGLGFLFGSKKFGDLSATKGGMKTIKGGAEALAMSEGGIVPGGSPYTDRVPAMLTPGERVITKGGEDKLIALVSELVGVVKQGGDVILDGNKVGKNLAMASSQIG